MLHSVNVRHDLQTEGKSERIQETWHDPLLDIELSPQHLSRGNHHQNDGAVHVGSADATWTVSINARKVSAVQHSAVDSKRKKQGVMN